MDQKLRTFPFVTEKDYAFEVLLKWRYDEVRIFILKSFVYSPRTRFLKSIRKLKRLEI